MANIDDFIEAEKIKENMKKSYNEGYHFQWIGQSHMVLDTMLKSYFYTSIIGSYPMRKFRDSQVGWMKGLSFWNILNIANIFGLLSDELFDNLKEVNEKRNLILHNLIMKNEKLNPIDLKNHFELCEKTLEKLVAEWLQNVHLQGISMQIFHEAMKKFDDKFPKEVNELKEENSEETIEKARSILEEDENEN